MKIETPSPFITLNPAQSNGFLHVTALGSEAPKTFSQFLNITATQPTKRRVKHTDAPNILVAEDDCNDENLLKWAFKKVGLNGTVHFVHDGAEVLDYLLGTAPFDDRTKYPLPGLLMIDLKMPRVDGFELLSWLRKLPGLNGITVVVMSGSTWEQDFERARALGADRCLNKWLDFSELVAAISGLVASTNN